MVRQPAAASNPFYLMVPHLLLWPMLILATLATVIASQVVISGAFSMTESAIRLRYLPRMTVIHTSATEKGQIYVPLVNWGLCVVVVAPRAGLPQFQQPCLCLRHRRHWDLRDHHGADHRCGPSDVAGETWALIPVAGFFFILDMSFFLANLTKFDHGGWFPLTAAVIIFTVLMTWSAGRKRLMAALDKMSMTDDQFREFLDTHDVPKIPGPAST